MQAAPCPHSPELLNHTEVQRTPTAQPRHARNHFSLLRRAGLRSHISVLDSCLPPVQVKRVGESLITIGGGPVWGPEGLTQAQLERALQQLTAGMERQGIAASVIRTRALPNAGKEDAGEKRACPLRG